LLVGSTPDGRHVELTFAGLDGWVEVGGDVVCRSQGTAEREIARLVRAFNDACSSSISSGGVGDSGVGDSGDSGGSNQRQAAR
jgi:hypothetical protein